MALFVNTNVSSLNAQRNLSTSGAALSTSLQRLSSGLRVNSAKDDAAGLAIATGMTAQVKGGNQAIRNANDAISLAQTAEGVLGQVTTNVQRMRELAVQGANATTSTTNRGQIKKELEALTAENDRLIQGAEFNGKKLFSVSTSNTLDFQVGAGTTGNDKISLTIKTAKLTGARVTLTFDTQANARSAIDQLDTALSNISNMRADLGAAQNRFSAVVTNLQNYVENLSASKSRIVDADFAAETSELTRNQIIQQAGTSMLQRANGLPQAALTLLQG